LASWFNFCCERSAGPAPARRGLSGRQRATGARVRDLPPTASTGDSHLAAGQAAAVPAVADDRRDARPARFLQDRLRTPPGVRRDDDVHLLRVSPAAQPADRSRLL